MRIRIGHLSTVYHTALLMRGLRLLERRGLRVSWRLFGGGPAIVEALSRGEVDLGYVGLPPAMAGIARGAPIRCVAGGHVEGTVLCIRAGGRGEEVFAALRGGRIGSPPRGSIHDIIIRHLLERRGVAAEVVNYPWADFIPLAFEAGEVDAAVGTPALATLLVREHGAAIALPPAQLWPFNPSYGIVAREEMLHTEELRTFVEVHEEASNLIRSQPGKAARVAASVLGFVDAGFALRAMELSPRYCAALPPEYVESTMRFVPVMRRLGYLSRRLGERDVFFREIVEEVHPEGHHYGEGLRRR
ncbi:MAG: ABC transporter substrate-binding protein [Euryarchaeota archaeon]|nr:ABC transporter substrate-binding protein [Euryarchaeota archaeon]